MKTILHLAVSADGYIAKKNGDSGWVSETDGALFVKRAVAAGCLVVGRTTFKQYQGDLFPIDKVVNIVLSRTRGVAKGGVEFAASPRKALALAKSKGFKTVLVAGGGKTSGAFLKEGLIDEIFLTVHPLVLGSGIKVFNGLNTVERLKLLDTKKLGEGLVQLHYKVA